MPNSTVGVLLDIGNFILRLGAIDKPIKAIFWGHGQTSPENPKKGLFSAELEVKKLEHVTCTWYNEILGGEKKKNIFFSCFCCLPIVARL